MATNPLSGNFQLPIPVQSGKLLPEKTNPVALKPAIIEKVRTEESVASRPSQTNEKAAALDSKETRDVQEFARNFEPFSQSIQRKLNFQIDDATGSTVIRVIDRLTNETIRQIPAEELLTLSRRLKEFNEDITAIRGVLISKEA